MSYINCWHRFCFIIAMEIMLLLYRSGEKGRKTPCCRNIVQPTHNATQFDLNEWILLLSPLLCDLPNPPLTLLCFAFLHTHFSCVALFQLSFFCFLVVAQLQLQLSIDLLMELNCYINQLIYPLISNWNLFSPHVFLLLYSFFFLLSISFLLIIIDLNWFIRLGF